MKNKLDAFAERLDEWKAEGKTLEDCREQLKADGCSVALSSLSDWFARRREETLEKELFATIATGGRMQRQLDAAYLENPEPAVEQLIKISKTLVMTLQVQGAANPKMLALANSMLQTVLNYLSGLTKAELERSKLGQDERKLALLEAAAARAAKTEEVLKAGLSAEEQARRIREIFKK